MHPTLGRTRKVNLVLLGGKALTGKTTSAKYLRDKLSEYVAPQRVLVKSFAEPIKEIAYDSFGWDGEKDDKGRKLSKVTREGVRLITPV